jgi:hypothetical protein
MVFYTMKRGTGNTNIFKILKPASQGGRENLALERASIPYTVKKRLAVFPSPAGMSDMSLTKLSLAGNN